MKKGLFITGTDTDVGKTFVSALICQRLSEATHVTYHKPVQAGYPTDVDTLANLLAGNHSVRIREPWVTLKHPASPHRAAHWEGVKVEVKQLLQCWDQLGDDTFHVVEGAGGLEVPINDQEKISDLIQALEIPCVVVASTRLGTINHTLLTVERLKSKGIPCLGLVLNGEEDPGLKQTLTELTQLPVLAEIPRLKDFSKSHLVQTAQFLPLDPLLQQSGESEKLQQRKPHESRQMSSSQSRYQKLNEEEWLALDQEVVWHPFTQHGVVKSHPIVTRAEGSYLWLGEDKVLDAVSSWWVNLLGHSHPAIAQAIAEQAQTMEHVLFAGLSHRPAIELSSRIIQLVQARGAPLSKVFFSDNGSTAVEVALKMAYQAQAQRGRANRKRFLAFHGSYHGDTFGAMSVGASSGFHKVFEPLLFDVQFVDPFSIDEIEQAFEMWGDELAAVIFEPMVQGAGGMRMYPQEHLDLLMELCQKYGVYRIADEIFTGFYRTGKMFAFEHSQMRPDLLCLSKGLTGGFLPLSLTVASQEIYEAFLGDSLGNAFLHGHSYTGNPIACRAALAVLDQLESPTLQLQIKDLIHNIEDEFKQIEAIPGVYQTRLLGTIAAFDLDVQGQNYFSKDFSHRFHQAALREGVLLRPLGRTIYMVPPLCFTREEVARVFNVMCDLVQRESL